MSGNFGWQKIISHLWPITIEKVNSPISGPLLVEFFSGKKRLRTGNAIYSFEDQYTSYRTALGKIEHHPEKSVLVLGLGMGSIPYILQKIHHYNSTITCVDIDSEMIRLTKKYYPFAEGLEKLELIEEDALKFVKNSNRSFNLICVDLFVGEDIPYDFWNGQFLKMLKDLLQDGGTLLLSRLSDRHQEEKELWDNLEIEFPGKEEVITYGNSIMIWQK